jgi:hypothetical protein
MMTPKDDYWNELDLNEIFGSQRSVCEFNSLLAAHPEALIQHDLNWQTDCRPNGDALPLIYLCGDGFTLSGYAAFQAESSDMQFSLGEIVWWRHPVMQFKMDGGILFRTDTNESQQTILIIQLFKLLRKRLRSGQVLFLQAVPCRSQLYYLLTKSDALTDFFHVFPYGSPCKRRLILLPNTFDTYMKQLGSKTRSDLNRSLKRLREHLNGALKIKCYKEMDTVSDFQRCAELISQKTYQWHLLKRGLRDREHFARLLKNSARHGWLRSYILFCKDEPVAFMVGHIYRGRYYSTDIGFDPAWGEWSVGNVLHCEVIRDLIEQPDAVTYFDFMGDRPTHQRLSNDKYVEEASFYVIPKNFKGHLLYYALLTTDTASKLTARILDTLHLKSSLRKLIRDFSTSRQTH